MARPYHTSTSLTSSPTSPIMSVWSRGHSSRSSGSSISPHSSPFSTRDSFDLYGTARKLEDVREEEDVTSPSTRQYCSFDDYARPDPSFYLGTSPSAVQLHYDRNAWLDQDTSSTSSSTRHQPKRQRSLYAPMHSVTQGFATGFGSISRRWRNRSTAAPQLSIITHHASFAPSQTSPGVSATWSSRQNSVASQFPDFCSPTSIHSVMEDTVPESQVVPIFIDNSEPTQEEEDGVMATTPLLPPTMLALNRQDSPLSSPLQSPSMVSISFGHHHALSNDHAFSYLPSPPLSTQPSIASMPRSRAQTATDIIPPLYLHADQMDPWSQKLGHADFSIHPEPYYPQTRDIDSYKEFRTNWAQARKQYAQHLARTDEHYGTTSKVYKLTEEKWQSIDTMWKNNDARLRQLLGPQLARLSDEPISPGSSVSLLDRPVTRVEVPELDKTGKFPELGDADIVGPLHVGVAKVPELQRGQYTPPTSPRKRNLIKYLGDIFKH